MRTNHKIRAFFLWCFLALINSSLLYAQDLTPGEWITRDPNTSPDIMKIIADPTDTTLSRLFAATSRGVYWSADQGVGWNKPTEPIAGKATTSLLYNNGWYLAGTQFGFFRSRDGRSWTSANAPLNGEITIRDIQIGNGRIFIGTTTGVFFSDDDGLNWTKSDNFGDVDASRLLYSDGRIYVGTVEVGIYFSEDGGVNWQATTVTDDGISTLKTYGDRLFAGSNGSGIYYSARTDGVNWANAASPMDDGVVSNITRMASGRLLADRGLEGIYYSDDNGTSWIHSSLNATEVLVLDAPETIDFAMAGTPESGVFTSSDGINWQQASAPMDTFRVISLAYMQNQTAFGSDRIFAGTQENGIFRNVGNDWFKSGGEITVQPNYFGVLVTADEQVLFGYSEEGVFKSEDGGISWQRSLKQDVNIMATEDNFILDTLYAGTDGQGVFVSGDGGRTWTQANAPIDDKNVRSLLVFFGGRAIATTESDGIFYSTNSGRDWTSANAPMNTGNVATVIVLVGQNLRLLADNEDNGIFYSDDFGVNWTQATGDNIENQSIEILIDQNQAGRNSVQYAGVESSGVYYSLDAGATWAQSTGEINNYTVNVIMPTFSTTLAGSNNGVYITGDDGQSWSPADPFLNGKNIKTLTSLSKQENVWYAGSQETNGLYRSIDNGLSWTPLTFGLTSVLEVRGFTTFEFEGEATRLFAATDNGLFLQLLDFNKPTPSFLDINTGDQYTKTNSVIVDLDADLADFMQISEDSTFANSEWMAFDTRVSGYGLSTTDGSKTVYGRFRDQSWNVSGFVKSQITLDQTKPQFEVAHQPPATLPTVTQQNFVEISQAVNEPNLDDMRLFYRRVGDKFSRNNFSFFENNRAMIDAGFVSNRGLDYRIIADDLAQNTDTLRGATLPDGTVLDFFSLPTNLNAGEAGRSENLSGGFEGSAFAIVSLPMKLGSATSVKSVLGDLGKYGASGDWRFYSYNGGNNWQEGENLSVSNGSAHFIILRNSRGLTNQVTGTSTPTTDGVMGTIPGWELAANDWTLIGNPYNFDIDLKLLKLQTRGTLLSNQDENLQVWAYRGGQWTQNDISLKRWSGLFVRSSEADRIVFANPKDPYNADAIVSKNPVSKGIYGKLTDDEWRMQITADADGYRDTYNYAGVKEDAKDELDKLDLHELPLLPGAVSLFFSHPEWETPAELTADIRPLAQSGYRWQVKVTSAKKAVQLNFSELETVPNRFKVVLLDEATGIVRDLRIQPLVDVRIPKDANEKLLTLLVGDEFYINQETDGIALVPATFALHQNYPNPFNPATTIRYALPQSGKVTLKIYDTLGREVYTVENQRSREAGFYESVVDFSDFASGLYFYRIIIDGAEKFQAVKKMLLVK